MNYNELPQQESIDKTVQSLKSNNFEPVFVQTRQEALQKVKDLLPSGAEVMNGSSETLREIGLLDILKSKDHDWNNLHDQILAETDEEKQSKLRKQSVISDYYLGSVHALTENGEMVISSNSGSQLPHLVYTSPNIILIVGAQKITPNLEEAFRRIEQHVVPLEDKRMQEAYGVGTLHAKTLIFRKENPASGRKITVIIVNEKLGF